MTFSLIVLNEMSSSSFRSKKQMTRYVASSANVSLSRFEEECLETSSVWEDEWVIVEVVVMRWPWQWKMGDDEGHGDGRWGRWGRMHQFWHKWSYICKMEVTIEARNVKKVPPPNWVNSKDNIFFKTDDRLTWHKLFQNVSFDISFTYKPIYMVYSSLYANIAPIGVVRQNH
jgi:hypothetical protein